jgi:hypothetical protein
VIALRRLCIRLTALGASVVLVAALAAGLVRLLPWLLAPEVPLEISAPFATALLAVATEATVLVALPVGFALAAATFVDRGEARGLLALGASPLRLSLGTLPVALGFAAVAFLTIASWDAERSEPGRFAAELLEEGRASCERADEPRGALVPLVGVTWLCFPGRDPRVAAPLPRSRGQAWFTARALHPSHNLRAFELSDLRVLLKLDSKLVPRVRISAKNAVVSGLTPWGRAARLSALGRATLLSATGAALALLAAWSVIRTGVAGRVGACAIGGAAAVTALWLLGAADAAGERYWLVPTGAAAALLLVSWLWSASMSRLARKTRLVRVVRHSWPPWSART